MDASGIKTIDDAKAREVTMGATAPAPNTSALYPRLTNTMLHTKIKIVTGYPGGADIDLAMERGELDGRGSNAWATLKATRPEWVRDQKVNILMQIGLARAKDLPDVPLLTELVKARGRRSSGQAPLRHDRDRTSNLLDPERPGRPSRSLAQGLRCDHDGSGLLGSGAEGGLDLNPSTGEEVQAIVADMLATPKSVSERLKAIIAGRE